MNDSVTLKFIDILNTFSLVQSINSATHRLGNTLDLIIHDPSSISISDIVIDSKDSLGKSDHYMIYFQFICNISVIEKQHIRFRDYKNLVLPNFHTDIINCTDRYIAEADINDFKSSFDQYCSIYGTTVSEHAPIVNKFVNAVARPPWMDSQYVLARKGRRQLYKKWKQQKSNQNRDNFVQSRTNVNLLAKQKRRDYYQNEIKSSKNSQRELFKICNSLLDTNQQSLIPYSENYNLLANSFNDYFVTKIENIRRDLKSNTVVELQHVDSNVSTFSQFKVVTMQDLLKIIKSSKTKTNSDDPIPAFLLKSSVEHLLPTFIHLVNASLQTGSMDGLKASIITPILKKSGLDQDTLSNYRPVCGGLYIDKLIQKSVLVQLNDHMCRNDLHISYQSGYKPHHSCETVLLRIVNDILMNLDSRSCSVLLLLDCSSAFDTVDHNELRTILHDEIGLRGMVLAWFMSFLSNRMQSTSVRGCRSKSIHMKYGVPRGSVLGPVLFNIYIRNFIRLLKEAGFIVHGYADDHQVFFGFRIQFQYHAVCHSLPNLLKLISNWMGSKFLKLNAGKSKLLIFAPKTLRDQIFIDRVYLGNNIFIPASYEAVNLGFKLDSEVTFSNHISMILSQSYSMISMIGKIKTYLTVPDLRCLVQCIIISKLDNCNSLLYGISEYEIGRLQKLQNSCARLIYLKKSMIM